MVGALMAGGAVYMLKPQQEAISPSDIELINKKTLESSFPKLRSSKVLAWQAMRAFEVRQSERQSVELCLDAITGFLSAAESCLARGDMDFMREDIERDIKRVNDFFSAHPELKRSGVQI